MQSTGHTSTQLASLVPMHGCVITYGMWQTSTDPRIPDPRLAVAILHFMTGGWQGQNHPRSNWLRRAPWVFAHTILLVDVPSQYKKQVRQPIQVGDRRGLNGFQL